MSVRPPTPSLPASAPFYPTPYSVPPCLRSFLPDPRRRPTLPPLLFTRPPTPSHPSLGSKCLPLKVPPAQRAFRSIRGLLPGLKILRGAGSQVLDLAGPSFIVSSTLPGAVDCKIHPSCVMLPPHAPDHPASASKVPPPATECITSQPPPPKFLRLLPARQNPAQPQPQNTAGASPNQKTGCACGGGRTRHGPQYVHAVWCGRKVASLHMSPPPPTYAAQAAP